MPKMTTGKRRKIIENKLSGMTFEEKANCDRIKERVIQELENYSLYVQRCTDIKDQIERVTNDRSDEEDAIEYLSLAKHVASEDGEELNRDRTALAALDYSEFAKEMKRKRYQKLKAELQMLQCHIGILDECMTDLPVDEYNLIVCLYLNEEGWSTAERDLGLNTHQIQDLQFCALYKLTKSYMDLLPQECENYFDEII